MTPFRVASACVIVAALLVAGSGCGRRTIPPRLAPVQPLAEIPPFTRVLVAGFVSTQVRGVDANQETSRLLRRDLRSEVSLEVVNMDPLQLQSPILEDVRFWQRLGEEYREPVIVTGVVDFKRVGGWYEERQVGRRIVRLWLPQYSLRVRLLLIDGKTGEPIASAVCGPTLAHSTTTRDRPLQLYFTLIDRTMPSMLALFGRRTAFRAGSGPTCRREEDELRPDGT